MRHITIALLTLALLACGGATAVNDPLPTSAPTAAVPTDIPPTLEPLPTAEPQKIEFEGTNDRVVNFAIAQAANVQFGALQSGEGGNFYVWLKDAELNDIELIANCINDCQETAVVRLEPGTYYLDVNNTFGADWYVVVVVP